MATATPGPAAESGSTEPPARPNIVLFVADQLRADHLGCYGHPLAVTPNIDALAARGRRYANCHVASTVCMPNRATMLTGRMPSLHGVRRNGIPLPHWQRTFPELLSAIGYRTALIGKGHLQPFGQYARDGAGPNPTDTVILPGSTDDYTMEFISRWQQDDEHGITSPYYGFDHAELCLAHGDLVEGDYARWLTERDPDAAERRGPEHALPSPDRRARDAWRTAVPEDLYPSAFVAQRAIEWLSDHSQNHADQPFLLVCSFPDPHHPFTPPGRFWDLVDPDDVELPDSFHQRSRSPLIDFIHRISRDGLLPHTHIPFAPDEREAREIIALTLGSVANIDARVGEVIQAIEGQGLAGDTITVFTTDHGDMMGDHGVFLKGPMHCNALTQVPLIWSDPHSATTADTDSRQASSLDLARTILGAAACVPAVGMQGIDLNADPADSNRAVLLENESAGLQFDRPTGFGVRSIRTPDWRLTMSDDPELCEMYDLRSDPAEVRNLWHEPTRAAQRRDLTDLLVETEIGHREQGITPWSGG